MAILSKAVYRFNVSPYQNTHDIFHRTRTNNPKIYMELQIPWIAKAILRKKNKAADITLPDFRQYYKATVIKQHGIGTKTDIQINGAE